MLDGRTLARRATMPQSATAVAFAPDGHQLLAVSFDGTVTAYEKPAWRAAASFRTNADGHVHLAYSTGGQFLLISDARATSLWDADRHKLIAEPLSLHGRRHERRVVPGAGARDRRRLSRQPDGPGAPGHESGALAAASLFPRRTTAHPGRVAPLPS